MKKVINVKLDPNSIADAINELQEYKREVERKARRLIKKLTARGADIVRVKIVEMGAVDKGRLLDSVDSFLLGDVGYIRVCAEYAMFVEFGTGIIGAGKTHPASDVFGWEYDIHGHGEAGWHFPADDGSYPITKGQPSRPFMYETAQKLRDEFPAIVKEVFG